MKQCRKCKVEKDVTMFNKHKRTKDGFNSWCKICSNKNSLEYIRNRNRTKDGLILNIFQNQLSNSKKRGHTPPEYNLRQLQEWFNEQISFEFLYNNWVESEFNKNIVPSVDRKDDSKGYSLDNIQLMTWKENKTKGYRDRMNGINNKRVKPVIQYDMDGLQICTFISLKDAERKTNIFYQNIMNCCKGIYKTAGGFIWKYKTDDLK